MVNAPQYGLRRKTVRCQSGDDGADKREVLDWAWTRHALCRVRQRGINPEVLDMLLEWGQTYPVSTGLSMVIFGRQQWRHMQKNWSKSQRIRVEKQPRLFAILDANGTVITVGHRTRHLRRP